MKHKGDLMIDLANRLYETGRMDELSELTTRYGRELTDEVENHIEYLLQ